MSGATTRYKDINNNNLSSFLGITTGFKKSFLGLQDMCLSFYHLFSYLLYIKRSNLRYHRFVSLAILTVWPLTPLRKLISAIPYSVNERSDIPLVSFKRSDIPLVSTRWFYCYLGSHVIISKLAQETERRCIERDKKIETQNINLYQQAKESVSKLLSFGIFIYILCLVSSAFLATLNAVPNNLLLSSFQAKRPFKDLFLLYSLEALLFRLAWIV